MLKRRSLFFILTIAVFVQQSNAQPWREREHPKNIFAGNDSVTREELQGTWICFASYYDGPANANRDDIGPWHLEWPETAIFNGDSLSEYNYPCEFRGTRSFTPNGDSILIGGIIHSIALVRDTLSICLYGVDDDHFYGRDYQMRRYVRGTVDPKMIARLNKAGMNLSCLTGTWTLVTTYDSGYDGNGIVDIKFPFTLPFTLKLNPEIAKTRMPNYYTYNLAADGVLRPFYISFNEMNDELHFRTQDWYKGPWPYEVTYSKVK